MFWNVLDEPRRLLLKRLVQASPVPEAYLAGGTALALLFGHRHSEDFDWFTAGDFDVPALRRRLEALGALAISETARGTFHGVLDGVRVTWLHYPNPLLRPLQEAPDLAGFYLASPADIGVMKLSALADRGALKDFVDLYELARQGLPPRELFRLIEAKFPDRKVNAYHLVKSLAFFDDARDDVWPVMLRDVTWPEMERYFLREQAYLLSRFFPSEGGEQAR